MTDAQESSHEAAKSLAAALREILTAGDAGTQERICSALEAAGHSVSQSKVSRLLRKLGAVKTTNESGETVYSLPVEPAPASLSGELSNLVMSVVANEAMIVVTTNPGAATFVARMFDFNKEKLGVIGTVAGDDTIFLVPASTQSTAQVVDKIKQLLF